MDGLDAARRRVLRGPRASATVFPTTPPTLAPRGTSGFTAVRRSNNGVYCLSPPSGIDPHDHPAVVSVHWNSTANPEGNASAMVAEPGFAGCAVDQFVVVTERQNIVGGALVSEPANDVGFTIIVP
jgi:hypothetical protein